MERRGSRNNSSVNLNDIGGSNNRDSYQQQQTLSRPVSSLGGNRASSALSSYGSTVPKTPRTRNGGLAESEIQKVMLPFFQLSSGRNSIQNWIVCLFIYLLIDWFFILFFQFRLNKVLRS